MMILDVYVWSITNDFIIWLIGSLCFFFAAYGRNKKYKSIPDSKQKEKKKVKNQRTICLIISIILALISILIWLTPVSSGPISDQWEYIETENNQNSNEE